MNQAEQRQAEVAGSWLTAIVDASDDAIVGITLDGVITSWNSGAQKLYGYSVQEVIGHSISILIPPDQPEEIPRILEKVRGGERLDRYESVHVCKNGRQLQVSIIVSPVRDAGGSVVGACAIARDITEHKRSEEKLRERETHLRVLTETMPTVPWSATPDGRIDYFSQRWLDLTGSDNAQVEIAVVGREIDDPGMADLIARVGSGLHAG